MIYEPHDYQKYATGYIESHPIAAVLLDMGLGKTSITLTALNDLLFDSFEVHKVLVVAPLRVARFTWSEEIEKWEHLNGLQYSVAVGTEKERLEALNRRADIYIINRENVQWLIEESGIPFDFDMVVIDELSSFKNHQAKRFRSLMKVRPRVKRIVGLTGTPTANGLMDLWAEFRLLDMGQRNPNPNPSFSPSPTPSLTLTLALDLAPTLTLTQTLALALTLTLTLTLALALALAQA